MSEGTRRQQQKETTAQRLFEVAVKLFLTRGYHETTVSEITEAAGVAKGTFFTHFPNKEAVLAHLGATQLARLTAAIAEQERFAAWTFRDQARYIFQILGQGIEGQRELVLMTAVEILRTRGVADAELHGIGALDRILAPLAEAAQARGELRADAPAGEIASMVRSLYFMAVFEWLRREDQPFFEVAARQLDLLLAGLQARDA